MKPKDTIAGASATAGVLALRFLSQAGTLLVLAWAFTPVTFAAYSAIASVFVTIGALAPFGTHLVLLREASLTPEHTPPELGAAIRVTLVTGTLLIAPGLLLAKWLLVDTAYGLAVALPIAISELFFIPLLVLVSVLEQGRGHTARSQAILLTPPVLRLFAACVLSMLDAPSQLPVFAWLYLVASLAALILHARPLLGAMSASGTTALVHKSTAYAALNLTTLSSSEADKALTPRLLAPEVQGSYALASRVLGALVLPVVALILTVLPRIYRASSDGTRYVARDVCVIAFVYGLIALAVVRTSSPILYGLFGTRYASLPEMLELLSIALPAMAFRIASGNTLMAAGHPWHRALIEIAGLITMLCVAVSLSLRGDPYAIARAVVAAEWLMALIAGVRVFVRVRG